MHVGTKYFDDNWFLSGVGERKLTHVMDFIDSAIYLKEKGLATKIGVLGVGESGSVTALASTFTEPLLFDCAVSHVTIAWVVIMTYRIRSLTSSLTSSTILNRDRPNRQLRISRPHITPS